MATAELKTNIQEDMMKLRDAISTNLKRIRREKGLSQIELADKLGINQGNYSKIESGKVIPEEKTLEALAHVFKCEETDLTSHPDLLEAVKKIDNFRND